MYACMHETRLPRTLRWGCIRTVVRRRAWKTELSNVICSPKSEGEMIYHCRRRVRLSAGNPRRRNSGSVTDLRPTRRNQLTWERLRSVGAKQDEWVADDLPQCSSVQWLEN